MTLRDCCPRCGRDTYKFNVYSHILHCTSCGFDENTIQLKIDKLLKRDKEHEQL